MLEFVSINYLWIFLEVNSSLDFLVLKCLILNKVWRDLIQHVELFYVFVLTLLFLLFQDLLGRHVFLRNKGTLLDA